MDGFWLSLKKAVGKLRTSALGTLSGHVFRVDAPDDDEDAKRLLAELLGLLGGGLAVAGWLIFKSLREVSQSQVIGVTSASPTKERTAIDLFGYCLQAYKRAPEPGELFTQIDSEEFPAKRIRNFLAVAEDEIKNIISDYYFVFPNELDDFALRFKQCGIWVITDDAQLYRIRDHLFGLRIFYTAGAVEILFSLRECLKKAGENIRSLSFDAELMISLRQGYARGFITAQEFQQFQNRFGFRLS